MKHLILYTLALCPVFFATSVWAHHSVNYHFDPDTSWEIEGVVKEFHFQNPHSGLVVEVANAEGETVIWEVETVGRSTLQKQGWTNNQFVPGQRVKVSGFLGRREEHSLYLRRAEYTDGSTTGFVYGQLAQPLSPEDIDEDTEIQTTPLGNWVRAVAATGPAEIGRERPDDVHPQMANLTEAGWLAADKYDPTTDDPSLECRLPSIVRVWGQPDFSPTNIRQEGDIVTIQHEMFDVVRNAYIGQSGPPENIVPNVLGHSIGWYEGETLYVETKGFVEGILLPHPGVPHSDRLTILEKFSVDQLTGALRMEWTATDPLYFSEPLTGDRLFVRSDIPVDKFDCQY